MNAPCSRRLVGVSGAWDQWGKKEGGGGTVVAVLFVDHAEDYQSINFLLI